jgi:hypothetical protein
MPSLDRAVHSTSHPIGGEDGSAQRGAGERRPRERGIRERDSGRGCEPGAECARSTGTPVVAHDDDRDSKQPSGEDRRETRITTDRHDDRRSTAPKQNE